MITKVNKHFPLIKLAGIDANSTKSQIRQLISSPQWGACEQVANEICDKINSEPKIKDDQWQTLQAILVSEGEVRGIRRLIQELYNCAKEAP